MLLLLLLSLLRRAAEVSQQRVQLREVLSHTRGWHLTAAADVGLISLPLTGVTLKQSRVMMSHIKNTVSAQMPKVFI